MSVSNKEGTIPATTQNPSEPAKVEPTNTETTASSTSAPEAEPEYPTYPTNYPTHPHSKGPKPPGVVREWVFATRPPTAAELGLEFDSDETKAESSSKENGTA